MNPFQHAVRLAAERKSVTTAQLLPSWRNNQPIFKDWDFDKAFREGFSADDVLFRCIQIRGKALASLPWYVEKVDANGEWERVPYAQSPIEQLLNRPNRYMSRQRLFTVLCYHRDLDGNALWTKVTTASSRGRPVELWPIQTRPLRPIPTRSQFIRAYEYNDGEIQELDARTVIHFMEPNPADPYWGMPPLRALAKIVDTSNAAVKWNKSSLDNRAMPELAFHTDQPLSQEEWEQARHEVALNYAGTDNARLPIVTGGGLEATVVNWKPIEMDFIASLAHYRERICNCYGVPLPVFGALENATEANVDGSRKQLWEDTMIPLADDVKGDLNIQLLPEFHDPDQYRICYDTSGVPVLRPDFGAKTDQLKSMFGCGVPLNAALKRLDMDIEDVEGGDEGYIPATMVPLADASKIANEPKVTPQPKLAA